MPIAKSILKNCHLLVNDGRYIGQIDEVTLPKLTTKDEEYQGAGMGGPVSIPMSIEKLEASFVTSSAIRDLLASWGLRAANSTKLEFRGDTKTSTNHNRRHRKDSRRVSGFDDRPRSRATSGRGRSRCRCCSTNALSEVRRRSTSTSKTTYARQRRRSVGWHSGDHRRLSEETYEIILAYPRKLSAGELSALHFRRMQTADYRRAIMQNKSEQDPSGVRRRSTASSRVRFAWRV
jgi:hypothetical protein